MARTRMLPQSAIRAKRISDGHIQGDLVQDRAETFQKVLCPPTKKRMIRSLWRVIRDPEDVADTLQEIQTR